MAMYQAKEGGRNLVRFLIRKLDEGLAPGAGQSEVAIGREMGVCK